MSLSFIGTALKGSAVLDFKDMTDYVRFDVFIKSIPEGKEVKMFYEVIDSPKVTTPQIAKMHAMIRKLANHLGYSFDQMKSEMKSRVGFEADSFADYTYEQAESLIETLRSYAITLNYPLD